MVNKLPVDCARRRSIDHSGRHTAIIIIGALPRRIERPNGAGVLSLNR